jgi:hypothetical protein
MHGFSQQHLRLPLQDHALQRLLGRALAQRVAALREAGAQLPRSFRRAVRLGRRVQLGLPRNHRRPALLHRHLCMCTMLHHHVAIMQVKLSASLHACHAMSPPCSLPDELGASCIACRGRSHLRVE